MYFFLKKKKAALGADILSHDNSYMFFFFPTWRFSQFFVSFLFATIFSFFGKFEWNPRDLAGAGEKMTKLNSFTLPQFDEQASNDATYKTKHTQRHLVIGKVSFFTGFCQFCFFTSLSLRSKSFWRKYPCPYWPLQRAVVYLSLPAPLLSCHHAGYYGRYSLSRDTYRLCRSFSSTLCRRSLRAHGKRHTEACCWCAFRTKWWKEREGVKQLCG